MRRGRGWLVAALVCLLAAVANAPAGAATFSPRAPVPSELRVVGAEWQADNRFRLDWTNPGSQQPAGVGYRVKSAAGELVVGPVRIDSPVETIEGIRLPAPGVYTAEVWLETALEYGAPAWATLRYDDGRPSPPRARPTAAWFGTGRAATLELDTPAGPPPLSGIRGHAVSVDRGQGSSPCRTAQRCSAAETSPGSAHAGAAIPLGLLPEGLSFARVVSVSRSGVASAAVTVPVRVDATAPQTSLAGAPSGWANGPVTVTARATDALSGMAAAGRTGPLTAISVDGGTAVTAAGASVSASVRGEGIHTVAHYARDAAGNVADGQALAPAPARSVVRIDETPPQVAFVPAQDPTEPERIEATVADALSGPDRGRGSIGVRPAGSQQRFAPLPTAVDDGRLVARWRSEESPPGSYEFTASAYDAAGNVASTSRRAGGAAMVLANPLKTPTSIGLERVGGRGPVARESTARYGRRAAIRGALLSAGGAPLPGQAVEIVETFPAGSLLRSRATTVHSGPRGAFRLRLPPGPSRTIMARFPGSATLTGAVSGPVRLGVASSVRLRASSGSAAIGGRPVLFSGRLAAGEAAVKGRSVELQFRVAGLPWSEFRTVRTDARGRFRYPYRFADDDSRDVRFQFRAFVPAQPGWPYESGASHPVIVTGR